MMPDKISFNTTSSLKGFFLIRAQSKRSLCQFIKPIKFMSRI